MLKMIGSMPTFLHFKHAKTYKITQEKSHNKKNILQFLFCGFHQRVRSILINEM